MSDLLAFATMLAVGALVVLVGVGLAVAMAADRARAAIARRLDRQVKP